MNAQPAIGSFWRPRPAADTSIAWNEQLGELDKVESEIGERVTALELARGTVLVSGTAEEASMAEFALTAARSELERIPVMRAEITARRDKAAAREEIAKFETERERISVEVAAVISEIAKLDIIAEPLLMLLRREQAIHGRVEEFNRRYREMAKRRNLDAADVLSAPIDVYWDGGAPYPYPIWRIVKIPSADLRSMLWNVERQ
jgi:hypothetical protein